VPGNSTRENGSDTFSIGVSESENGEYLNATSKEKKRNSTSRKKATDIWENRGEGRKVGIFSEKKKGGNKEPIRARQKA